MGACRWRTTAKGCRARVAARAFDPFLTTKPLDAGPGWGLANVHGIVRDAGGMVRLDSSSAGARSWRWAAVLNVVLVENDAMVREGVEVVLRRHGHAVVGRAGDATGGYCKIVRCRPHVALVDCDLGAHGGLDLARRLRSDAPEVAVVLYTGRDEEGSLREALKAGAAGVLLKAGSPGELVAALEAAAAGNHYVDPRIAALLEFRRPAGRLSAREREIFGLLADGMNLTSIADEFGLSRETVKTHVRNAMSKLGTKTRTAAVVEAIRTGEVVRPEE